jgi:hypothetical protein
MLENISFEPSSCCELLLQNDMQEVASGTEVILKNLNLTPIGEGRIQQLRHLSGFRVSISLRPE